MPGMAGKHILVPVTPERRELADAVRAAGAVVTEVQCIAIAPTGTPKILAGAVIDWCGGRFAWLAVTSRNAVLAMAREADRQGRSLQVSGASVAAVGEATTRVCHEVGLEVDLIPEQPDATGLVAAFPQGEGAVLVPVGNLASAVLARGISGRGWQVQQVEAYRTVDGPGMDGSTVSRLVHGEIDAVVLTSASVARRVAADLDGSPMPADTVVVAIGDSTAAAARRVGLVPTSISATPSHAGILEALEAVFEESA